MFKPTKPFDDRLTTHPKEPSLRIGRNVPEHAVNLAYYYNPTATDAEKILTAEAPRNTIDHRVEEAYRYLFDQASDDDDLFPGYVWYQDEEGYQGRLGRMYVQWYPEAHILLKNVQQTKEIIVVEKSELPKTIEYSDTDGYLGNLYLDAATYEVTKTKDVSTSEERDVEVYNHEVSYHIATGGYIESSQLDRWMVDPSAGYASPWPSSITVGPAKFTPVGGNNNMINNYISNLQNFYDGAIGELTFDGLEYEQVTLTPPSGGSSSDTVSFNNTVLISETFDFDPDITLGDNDASEEEVQALRDFIKECSQSESVQRLSGVWEAEYNMDDGTYDYSAIEEFLALAEECASNPNAMVFTKIRNAMSANKDIAIYTDYIHMVVDNQSDINSTFHFEAAYKCKTANVTLNTGVFGYNVIAKYKGILKKNVIHIKEVAAEYKATCSYIGIVRKVWYDYDGVAYYRGAVTKGNGVGNVNPEGDNELLMFSDENGYLRRPVWVTDENGIQSLKNFYRIESDYVYITDVFKDGTPCFYRYPLKKPIYDYRGPDDNGFYEGNAVKMFTSGLKDIPDEYKHRLKLKVSEYETVQQITNNFNQITVQRPMRYDAELYTSFISSSTDTFKVTYNAFDDNDKNNIALDNGVTEDVYGYPFMHQGKDFFLEPVDRPSRINKIRLPTPARIADSRRYVTFSYTITAERKSDGKKFTTSPRTVSILNRDYVVPIEYSKFDGRAMIISPESDGILQSPFDLVLYDQAASRAETVITSQDTDFVFSATITDIQNDILDEGDKGDFANSGRGAINIKVNADGSGYITAETTVDTGFFDDRSATFTKKLCLDNPYFVEGGYIYPGFKVKCVDARHIKVLPPREEHLLQSWYPRLQFGHYSQILDQYGTHTKVCYSMPEYDTQHFSTVHGKPYVDIVQEPVTVLNSHMVKTKCFPLYINDNKTTIKLYKKVNSSLFDIKIRDISFSDGVIVTVDTISEADLIVCDYTYAEESYVYRGFWQNSEDFARIDLNPNMYHTFSDLTYTPSQISPTKNLFNKVIYFFMRPTIEYEVKEANDSLIFNIEDETPIGQILRQNKECLYHQIDNAQPADDHDIYVGSIYIRQNTSLHSTILVDSRTRGGGLLESMPESLRKQLEPESDYYLDIGYYDGEPYQENGVIIVRLDNRLLKEFGGRFTQGDIESKVKRWLGFGIYPIIEYVDTYTKKDMPQYSLEVEDSYVNIIDVTPEILLECVRIS